MSDIKLRKLIEDYLETASLMQVTTAKNNQPWACTVYYAYDKHLNLYWISKPSDRHSLEIKANNKVAGAIVLPHKLGDDVRGLQFQGVASELTNLKEASIGLFLLAKRIGLNAKRIKSILDYKDGHMCYKITPTVIVLFDQLNYPDDPRQEYKL